MVNIVRMLYLDCQAQIICRNKLTQPFPIQTGVKQACILSLYSLFLFSLGIDWIMTDGAKDQRGIPWNLSSMLSDLDYADDIYILAHRHTDMLAMTVGIASTAAILGLKASTKKTKHMRVNHR